MPLILPRETHFHHTLEKVKFHFWQPESSISPEHTHEYCELFLVESGSGIHVCNEKPYLLTSGTLFYLNRQDYHLFEAMKDLKQVNLLYSGRDQFNVLKNITHLLPAPEESPVWQIDSRIMQRIIERMANVNLRQFDDKLMAESHKEMVFLDVLHTLSDWRYKTQDFHSSEDRLSQLIIYLNSHYAEPLDMEQLCAQFGMARRTLQRAFSQYTGVSPQQYLSLLRLLQAKYFLCFSGLSVGEVAQKCGFGDISHFSSAFRKQFGISPNQCR